MTDRLRGLKPLDPAKHARFKTAADYGFTWPAPSYPIDKTGGIENLGMGGNGPDPDLTVNGGQPVGDCGPNAAPKNVDQTTAVLAGVEYTALTSNQIVTLYFIYQAEQSGSDWRPTGDDWSAPEGLDVGVDLGDWLLWLLTHDLNGDVVEAGEGLVEAFVKLDLDELEAALGTAGAVVVGVNLNPDADEQVEDGQPWDIGEGDEPDPDDGHAIILGSVESADGPFGWGTWGQWQPSTLAWRRACPQQAFAVVTPEEVGEAMYAALLADLKALGGKTAPTPAAPPAPSPPVPPEPVTPPVPVVPPGPGVIPKPRPPLPLWMEPWWRNLVKLLKELGHEVEGEVYEDRPEHGLNLAEGE